jgi:ATP-dependent phosphofructokinase / diphosphate-dependent phosphofructokinase
MPVTTLGIVTAGGDCPGTNAAIRGVVTRACAQGWDVVGVEKGWKGLMEGLTRSLTRDDVRGVIARGGTLLGTSRLDPYVHGGGYSSVRDTVESAGIECLVVIGGDGTLRTAARLQSDGLRVIGLPKTIDNDVGGTDVTFGFHTAVQVVTDAIDRLTTTAESHDRIMVVEVMGRTTGWIAACGGMAGGAEVILVPEVPYDISDVADRLTTRHRSGRSYSLVVVAEGAPSPAGRPATTGIDAFGFDRFGGTGSEVAAELERLTGYEARVVTLGHLQRGGTPTAYDRILATRMGLHAAELAIAGQSGVMVALRGDDLVAVDLDEASREPRHLDVARFRDAEWFFA